MLKISKLTPISLLTIGCLSLSHPVTAATYTSPLLDWSSHSLQSLTWIFDQPDTPNFELAYFTTTNKKQDPTWQTTTNYTCQPDNNRLVCQLVLPSDLDTYLQFRLTYPDDIKLQTFNLNLSPVTSDTPQVNDNEQIFYSKFKTLDSNTPASQISWQQVALTHPVSDRIIVHTRASYNGQTWSDWQGNSQSVLTLHPYTSASDAAQLSLQPGHITLSSLPTDPYDRILISYLDQHHSYQLTSPLAAGADETAAFANLSFTLDSLAGLHLGQTIIITQTVDGQDFSLTGIISDLKPSDNLVSVFSWQGAIPHRPAVCGDHSFCFSTTATLHPLQEIIFAAPTDDNLEQLDLTLYQDAHQTQPLNYTPTIYTIDFLAPTTPQCLEYEKNDTDDNISPICRTPALSLQDYYRDRHPVSLQYRLIYGTTGDMTVSDVFLHQAQTSDTPSTPSSSLNRLRGGKVIDFTTSRPYYWH